eukprot:gene17113-12249_t
MSEVQDLAKGVTALEKKVSSEFQKVSTEFQKVSTEFQKEFSVQDAAMEEQPQTVTDAVD